jgi:hypothetical protein
MVYHWINMIFDMGLLYICHRELMSYLVFFLLSLLVSMYQDSQSLYQ